MLSRLEKKVREFVSNHVEAPEITPEIKENPLFGYLRIFQNQHRVISILYRGLIVAFSGFILLLSLLILNVLSSDLLPWWGAVSLVLIDLFLIGGIWKAFYELGRYRRQSVEITHKIYEHLRHDLLRLEKIKTERSSIIDRQRKLQNRIRQINEEVNRPEIEEYSGWDKRVCPSCRLAVEMLEERCPYCHQQLGKTLPN